MATTTFSGRAEKQALNFADKLTKQAYGLSYGQYCSSVLLAAIKESKKLPSLTTHPSPEKAQAATVMKQFYTKATNPSVGMLSDEEMREMIAGRYV